MVVPPVVVVTAGGVLLVVSVGLISEIKEVVKISLGMGVVSVSIELPGLMELAESVLMGAQSILYAVADTAEAAVLPVRVLGGVGIA